MRCSSVSNGATGEVVASAPYPDPREAMDAEGGAWPWTAAVAEIGEAAAELFDRPGGSLGTALAMGVPGASIRRQHEALSHTDDPRIESSSDLGEHWRLVSRSINSHPAGLSPVRL